MNQQYDAIVVGARCAGAPTAMLLARKGYKVLLVDRAGFPSDTVSTHVIHAPGIAALRRWNLLDQVLATGCPPINTYSFDFGPFTISGVPRPVDGSSTAYAPRRTVLDKILVDAAAAAGVEVREHFSVEDVMVEDGVVVGIRGHGSGASTVTERARVVIGADGRNSRIAKAVQPHQYNDKPMLLWGYYTYWSDLPVDGFETIVRPDRGWAAAPTNDGLTMLVVGWRAAEADAYKANVEANYLNTLEMAPEFAERVRRATRQDRFTGGGVPNFFRTPYGPGWALVGDAGYTRDPITAQGITDAFRDAELCATALDESFTGIRPYADAMTAYQHTRDQQVLPIFDFTTQLATLAPPPPEMQQLLGAVHGNTDAMSDFVSVAAGTLSPADFFDPANIGQIFAAAGAAVG
jgi:flavin-dependent dehydrogenase